MVQSLKTGLALSYAHTPHFLPCMLQRLMRGAARSHTCTPSSPLHLHEYKLPLYWSSEDVFAGHRLCADAEPTLSFCSAFCKALIPCAHAHHYAALACTCRKSMVLWQQWCKVLEQIIFHL